MKNLQLNYETLIKITKSLSKSKDPEEIIRMTVQSIQSSLGIKGCALFLINTQTKDLEVAASAGLSDEYLNKGTVSALRSIADSLKDGPVAVYDVSDDPRIQYPEAAQKEGISKKRGFHPSFPYRSWSGMSLSEPFGPIQPKNGNLLWMM